MAPDLRSRLRALGGPGEVRLDLTGPGAVLTLDQPARRNALSGKMLAELADAVDALEAWDGATLIVTGEGGFFCAGADLNMLAAHVHTAADAEALGAFVRGTLTRLRRLPVISVAAVEGGALGGGAELTTACDHRVLARDARVRFVQVTLGVCTGWGGGPRLVRLVGRGRALDLLASARQLGAQEALQLGLAERLAPPGDALRVASELLAPYRAHAAPAVKAMKAVVAEADDAPLDDALAVEARRFADLWGGPTNQQALASRRNKP